MLVREDDRGVLAIGQQSHAWLAGQLARAWGNASFGTVAPLEEVCLAAQQHDIGWAAADLDPLLDPAAGLPRDFMDMPLDVHLDIWTQGPRALLSQSVYAALLVSIHGTRLYQRRDLDRVSPEDATAIRGFLSSQRSFQDELQALLKPDRDQLERNSLLVWTWDYLSLALCLDWADATARGAPTADGGVDIRVLRDDRGSPVRLAPYPFTDAPLKVRCEGRRLAGSVGTLPELRRALAAAPIEAVELVLAPD